MKRSLLLFTTGFCGLVAVAGMVAAESGGTSASPAVAPAAGSDVTTCADAGVSAGTLAGAVTGSSGTSSGTSAVTDRRAVTFDGTRLVLAAEYAPGSRPTEQVNGVAASTDGTTLVTVVDAKGADRLRLSTDAGTTWTTVADGADLANAAVAPSGSRIAWTADGTLTVAAAATSWKPVPLDPGTVSLAPGRTYAQFPRFVGEDRLLLTLDVPIADVEEHVAGLADVWSHDLTTGTWTRLTSGKADADRWSVATTPLLRADGTLLYVLSTGLGSGSDTDLRTELRSVGPDGVDTVVTELPHRWGLIASAADGSLLFNAPDEQSRWQLVRLARTGERTELGCARAAWAAPLNHDPDRG
jgi:hypothetical protein